MQLLLNTIQRYDWGSTTALPALVGSEPDGHPQAELWMGTHPVAPSRLADGRELAELTGPLPFLLKVLAAAQPLSIQAHPSLEQARAGFAREEAAGIPINAPHRSYRDANHKPELICALEPFEALCGFRAVAESVELLEALGAPAWARRLDDSGLATVLAELFTLDVGAAGSLVDDVLARAPGAGLAWLPPIATIHPGDVGLVVAVLLNHVLLQPGEALYLGAGNLHAYLRGTGVEVMANSDNVLRGGLTTKHVDVPELLTALDLSSGPVTVIRPGADGRYRTPAAEFELTVLHDGTHTLAPGPSIVLLTAGTATLTSATQELTLRTGQSAAITADDHCRAEVHGTLFLASTRGASQDADRDR